MGEKAVRLLTVSMLFILIFCSTLLFGQATDATLVGIVTDQSGSGVPNAAVSVENVATGIKINVKTNGNGEYRINNLAVGRYNLTATAEGFAGGSLKNVEVILNQTATANIALQVGAVATSVDVTDAAAVIDTT